MGYSLYKYFVKTEIRDKRQEERELDSNNSSSCIRHCEALKEPWQSISQKTNNFEVQVFKPSMFKPLLKGYCSSFKDYAIYFYWLVISYFELAIYYVKDGEKLIHTSLVTGKSFKFPFMGDYDLHIGPCITDEKYRGRGIYPKVLQKIASDYGFLSNCPINKAQVIDRHCEPSKDGVAIQNNKLLYMIIEDSNLPSIKGVTKAGFKKVGKICKYKELFSNRYTLESDDWKYYNHAVIPNTAPHITPDLIPIKDGTIWNIDGKFPLFVRWTSDFDGKEETEWWYVIKTNEYIPEKLHSKKRYYIRKGRENYYTKIINSKDYALHISEVCYDAFEDYPEEYKPNIKIDLFRKDILSGFWDKKVVFGAFSKETNELCGILAVIIKDNVIHLDQLKAKRAEEKNKVNFALIDSFLNYYNGVLTDGNYYIVNNERNLIHQTNFPNFLCKYFDFKKAYCKLNIAYRPILRPFVFILYLFRRTIKSLKNKSSLLYKINAVLEMESIARKCRAMK